jgi:hypothetical protein
VRSNQGVALAQCVRAIAGPAVASRIVHHACAHRVQFDVAIAVQQIAVAIHKAGLVPPLPQGSAAVVAVVYIAHVSAPERLHEPAHLPHCRGCQKQVHVVGHEDIRMNRAVAAESKLHQLAQVPEMVLLTEEAWPSVVPPLHHMLRNTRYVQPWLTWHVRLLAQCPQSRPSASPTLSALPSPSRQKSAL